MSIWAIQVDINSAPLVEDEAVDDELAELFYRVQGAHIACSITDLITAESELPTCSEFADESWNDEFMAEIGPRSKDRCLSSDEDDAPADIEPSLPRLNTFREARGVGRIFMGGFHDHPAKLTGRGYATCACVYYLDESGVSAGELEKLYLFYNYRDGNAC